MPRPQQASLLPGECGAMPLEGGAHGGEIWPYVRVCPAGHLRAGYCCEACRGEHGAILCPECDLGPAILIRASVFREMPFGSTLARLRELESTAEATGG
jgi:hypothetical protein